MDRHTVSCVCVLERSLRGNDALPDILRPFIDSPGGGATRRLILLTRDTHVNAARATPGTLVQSRSMRSSFCRWWRWFVQTKLSASFASPVPVQRATSG